MEAKLKAAGVDALIADYDELRGDEDGKLVQGALRLSAHVVGKRTGQLAGQLAGRLRAFDRTRIKGLVAQIEREAPRPWLCPRTPSLIPPGGPLLRAMAGHEEPINTLALTPDGRCAVSASADRTLRMWDLATGAELRQYQGHKASIDLVRVTADGRCAVSASHDRTLIGIDPSTFARFERGERYPTWKVSFCDRDSRQR